MGSGSSRMPATRTALRIADGGGGDHAFHLYVIRTPRRNELQRHLREHGVVADIHYPVPAHRQEAFADWPSRGELPVTDTVVGELLSLPMYPELGEDLAIRVASLVRDFFG